MGERVGKSVKARACENNYLIHSRYLLGLLFVCFFLFECVECLSFFRSVRACLRMCSCVLLSSQKHTHTHTQNGVFIIASSVKNEEDIATQIPDESARWAKTHIGAYAHRKWDSDGETQRKRANDWEILYTALVYTQCNRSLIFTWFYDTSSQERKHSHTGVCMHTLTNTHVRVCSYVFHSVYCQISNEKCSKCMRLKTFQPIVYDCCCFSLLSCYWVCPECNTIFFRLHHFVCVSVRINSESAWQK